MSTQRCKTCAAERDIALCLDCGHGFCPLHLSEQHGVPTCAACLKEAQARKQRAAERAAAQKQKAAEAAARRADASVPRKPNGDGADDAEAPLPPLPEPAGSGPLLWGIKAAAPTAIYFWFFLGWLAPRQDLPGWVQPAGTALFTAVAFAGVWAIAKTRASSSSSSSGGL